MVASGVGPGEHGEKTGIWIINVLSATPRQIRGDAEGAVPSPDGRLVAFRQPKGVSIVEVNGENARSLLSTEVGATYGKLQWSPDGSRLAVLVRHVGDSTGAIDLIDLSSGARRELFHRAGLRSFVWLADGRFIYAVQEAGAGSGSALYSIEEGGAEQRLDVSSDMSVADMSASLDAHRIALVRSAEQTDVYFTEPGKREAGPWRRITLDDRDDVPTDLSTDGSVLFYSWRNGDPDVFRQRLDSPLPDLVAGGPDRQTGGQFSPEGADILYWSRAEGSPTAKLMSVPATGGTPQTLFEVNGEAKFRCRHSSACAVGVLSQQGSISVSTFDPKRGTREEKGTVRPESSLTAWNVSGDASVALATAEAVEVHAANGQSWKSPLKSVPGKVTDLGFVEGSGDLLVTTTSSVKNSLLLVERGGVKVLLEDRRELSSPVASPDGRKLLFGVKTNSSNVWLIDGI